MTLRILIDMNLSPMWTEVLERRGWQAVHWSTVGDPRASDGVIMQWAQENGYIVFTHDLDFGAILAATQARGPSVIQLRAQDILGERLQVIVCTALELYQLQLEAGALIVVDEARSRVRILPLRR
jgi:predicted nuclease of predicted toxin-antitoxin system